MYTSKIYKQPFWAENSGFTTGRDPLGIQNSSMTVYARLLPGMTNLTQRLRYYGFYCWLLKEYHDLEDEEVKRTPTDQHNFIRRAELMIAFIMAHKDPSLTSVIGSNFTARNFDDIYQLGYYDIAKGANKIKSTAKGSVYWDYPSGGLGQYYIGSLINLELVEVLDRFFHITSKGTKLANSFKKSIDPSKRSKYLELISKGKLSQEDIDNLEDFSLSKIEEHSEEWNHYLNMLMEHDGVNFRTSDGKTSTNRKETINLYLQYLINKPDGLSFDEYQYDLFINNKIDSSTNFGWSYYYINEVLHYCIETLFWGLLVYLDGKMIPINRFIDQVAEKILQASENELKISSSKTVLEIVASIPESDLVQSLKELEELTKSTYNVDKAVPFAIKTIFQTYLLIEHHLQEIKHYENLHYLGNQKGIISEHIKLLVADRLEFNFKNYLIQIFKYIINDHISTAYRKMGSSEVNLLKFIIEDNLIGHIQTMQPKHTNPRIKSLHKLLHDLGLVTVEDEISERGIQLLEKLNN